MTDKPFGPFGDQSFPIDTAPRNGKLVWVYAPGREGLPPIECACAWDEIGGWCVDEIRYVTHWRPITDAERREYEIRTARALHDLECVGIEGNERTIHERKVHYLKKSGWTHSSDTVGSYWMWFKDITTPRYLRGEVVGEMTKSYGCSLDDAFRIQKTLDLREYDRLHPDETFD